MWALSPRESLALGDDDANVCVRGGPVVCPVLCERGMTMITSMSRREMLAGGLMALACAGTASAFADEAKSESRADTVSKLVACPVNLAEDLLDDAIAAYSYDG